MSNTFTCNRCKQVFEDIPFTESFGLYTKVKLCVNCHQELRAFLNGEDLVKPEETYKETI